MAKFFVGQRVRILWSNGWPELAGQEARIVPVPTEMPAFANRAGRPWAVAPDCWGGKPYKNLLPGTPWFGPHPDQLEPILPDGHRACDENFKRDLDRMLEGVVA